MIPLCYEAIVLGEDFHLPIGIWLGFEDADKAIMSREIDKMDLFWDITNDGFKIELYERKIGFGSLGEIVATYSFYSSVNEKLDEYEWDTSLTTRTTFKDIEHYDSQ